MSIEQAGITGPRTPVQTNGYYGPQPRRLVQTETDEPKDERIGARR